MNKFKKNVSSAVIWLSEFWPFSALFEWMVKDQKNTHVFLILFNVFSTSLYFTAVFSPWIYLAWSFLPIVLFRTNPIAPTIGLITMVRDEEIGFGSFMISVLFMMLQQICLFACLYMIFGVIEGNDKELVAGLWGHFYFSVVTFTTLGYGNMVPINMPGEAIAAIEALMGFAIFALLIGVAAAVAMQPKENPEI